MTIQEFSDGFDLGYNNITSNQAPGLNEWEKSWFLTKAEKEIVLNFFSAQSAGNTLKLGFDDSAKRQADFSVLMKVAKCEYKNQDDSTTAINKIDYRSAVYNYPTDVFIVVNETLLHKASDNGKYDKVLQVIPLRYDEYTRLMSKPFKRPLKNQAWRLINTGTIGDNDTTNNITGKPSATKTVEIITGPASTSSGGASAEYYNEIDASPNSWEYQLRYVRVPKPIIVGNLDGLTLDGESTVSEQCEVDPILHEAILQRAIELAKAAWTATGQDNTQAVLQMGQRSE